MRPMNRAVPKEEDSEPEKTIDSATDCTPLAAAPLEWDDEIGTCELWQRVRDLGLGLEVMDRTRPVRMTS